MSMPSDVTPDITEAMEAAKDTAAEPIAAAKRLTTEQLGLIAAATVAFLGVAFLGPALARIGKPKPLSQRAEDTARDLRLQAEAAALRPAGRCTRRQTPQETDTGDWAAGSAGVKNDASGFRPV